MTPKELEQKLLGDVIVFGCGCIGRKSYKYPLRPWFRLECFTKVCSAHEYRQRWSSKGYFTENDSGYLRQEVPGFFKESGAEVHTLEVRELVRLYLADLPRKYREIWPRLFRSQRVPVLHTLMPSPDLCAILCQGFFQCTVPEIIGYVRTYGNGVMVTSACDLYRDIHGNVPVVCLLVPQRKYAYGGRLNRARYYRGHLRRHRLKKKKIQTHSYEAPSHATTGRQVVSRKRMVGVLFRWARNIEE